MLNFILTRGKKALQLLTKIVIETSYRIHHRTYHRGGKERNINRRKQRPGRVPENAATDVVS